MLGAIFTEFIGIPASNFTESYLVLQGFDPVEAGVVVQNEFLWSLVRLLELVLYRSIGLQVHLAPILGHERLSHLHLLGVSPEHVLGLHISKVTKRIELDRLSLKKLPMLLFVIRYLDSCLL
mmetsp:Transcript_23765/g.36445  ORF Transcript_23765/g.36445 Transcript_23765/m.36445 type:complete len:122 (+) Transcript_23765:730-1095(+)